MAWEAWVTLATVVLMVYALARNLAGPDVVLMGAAVFLTAFSLVSARFPAPSQLAAMCGNEGVLTVAALFVVAAGLSDTGAMQLATERVLGRPGTSVRRAQLRLMLPVAGSSAPSSTTRPSSRCSCQSSTTGARRCGLPASKLFHPAELRGRHRRHVHAHRHEHEPHRAGHAAPGAPLIPVVQAFLMFTLGAGGPADHDRPGRSPSSSSRCRGCCRRAGPTAFRTRWRPAPVHGRDARRAGQRRSRAEHRARRAASPCRGSTYPFEIERDGEIIAAVGPEQVLRGNDRLIFVGVVSSIVDLQRIRGLRTGDRSGLQAGREPRPGTGRSSRRS